MKRQTLTFAILFFGAIIGLFPLPTAHAQGTVSGQQFNINFSPLPDSPGTNQPYGGASYFQSGLNFNTFFTGSNFFVISISLGTNQATDGWVLQMEQDGSFSPVTELTNEFVNALDGISSGSIGAFPGNNPTGSNYYYQGFQITDDQVQSLMAGNWYAEVDYGDDKYIGNLTTTSAPQATITIPSATVFRAGIGVFPNVSTSVVIAPDNNQPAIVELDGSKSTDPFYIPLRFSWQVYDNNFSATTSAITNSLRLGDHAISLEVNDGYKSNDAYLVLEVITPGMAVGRLNSMVEQLNLNRIKRFQIASILSQAENAFNRKNTTLGVRQLQNFQNQVRLQITRTDSATASWLIEAAQEIIDAAGQQQNRHFNFRF
jgi:hypothetical protein